MFYNLYINNRQLFIQFSLEKIVPTPPTTSDATDLPSALPPLLRDTIGIMLTLVLYVISYPLNSLAALARLR